MNKEHNSDKSLAILPGAGEIFLLPHARVIRSCAHAQARTAAINFYLIPQASFPTLQEFN